MQVVDNATMDPHNLLAPRNVQENNLFRPLVNITRELTTLEINQRHRNPEVMAMRGVLNNILKD